MLVFLTIPRHVYYAESFDEPNQLQIDFLQDFRAIQERIRSYGYYCELIPDNTEIVFSAQSKPNVAVITPAKEEA